MTGYKTHCFNRGFFSDWNNHLFEPGKTDRVDFKAEVWTSELLTRGSHLFLANRKNCLFLNSFNLFFCQLVFSPLSLYTCQVKFSPLPKITITKTHVFAGTHLQPGTESCWDFPALLLSAFHSFGFHFYLLWYKTQFKKKRELDWIQCQWLHKSRCPTYWTL